MDALEHPYYCQNMPLTFRQVVLDGIGSFFFENKKAAYPPLPFKLGSYNFTRVKKADEFVEELGKFHFGEINLHRNDS